MKNTVNNIVRNLFQKMNLSEISQENLDEFKQSYPYSAIGYLLSARLKKEKGEPFVEDANMAALFINNPLWLHALLNEQYTSDTNPFIIPVTKANPPVVVPIQSKITEDILPKTETEIEIATPPSQNEIPESDAVSTERKELPSILDEEPSQAPEHVDESVSLKSSSITFTNEEATSPKLSQETILPEIAFEPYHTIDYFASQGIKLKMEDLKDDQFSRQLKSFTEWLRTMKRISPIQDAANSGNKDEEEATILPTHQVEESDIATEAMAEVWLKQGQKNRALAIYHKLSLQNPSKSHYFATKIENLKA